MSLTTWRKSIAATATGDSIIACTLTETELDVEFDDGFGAEKGKPFTAWSDSYVYFPVCYDGSEWAGRAPRHPCDKATQHQGG